MEQKFSLNISTCCCCRKSWMCNTPYRLEALWIEWPIFESLQLVLLVILRRLKSKYKVFSCAIFHSINTENTSKNIFLFIHIFSFDIVHSIMSDLFVFEFSIHIMYDMFDKTCLLETCNVLPFIPEGVGWAPSHLDTFSCRHNIY